ncbi:MAG: acyl-CoA thioesterase [Gaiellaceae bacterium]
MRFSETDAQGVVHNAVYLVWFEIARIAYLEQFRGGYKGLVEQGIDATTMDA